EEDGDVKALVHALRAPGQDNQIALRRGARYVPRLSRHEVPARATALSTNSTYLITGGLGSLGLQVAQWLVSQGARYLGLVGRRAPSDTALQAIRRMQPAGAHVCHESVDVADRRALTRLFDRIQATTPPLRGIIHAAGVLDDAIVLRQDQEKLHKTFAPKVQGAWHLHELTASMPLDFCIYFSSTAALFGSRCQGNYAAANAFLDALAHYRRALGLVGLSINWGPWADTGMAAVVAQRQQVDWARLGIDPIAPARGLDLLGKLLWHDAAQVGVVRINWPRFSQAFFRGATPAFFQAFNSLSYQDAPSEVPGAQTKGPSQLLAQLKAARPAARRALLTTYVCTQIAHVLRSTPAAVQPRQGLFDAGLDSLMAIELKDTLAGELGLALPQTFLFA